MSSAAGHHRRPLPSDADAILNALPNPVLLIGPDGKIADANMAAESFFDISTQFLQRQSLKELVPFGSPLLALIDQVRNTFFIPTVVNIRVSFHCIKTIPFQQLIQSVS